MKAAEITDALIAELETGGYRHARVNFANGDMVAHTGRLEPAIVAMEAVDLQLARLLPVVERLRGALIVTADHGNADCMFDVDPQTGDAVRDADGNVKVRTSHTLNPVPFHVYAPGHALRIAEDVDAPGLANVAATVLHLLGLRAPDDYAPSLLVD